MSDSYLARLDAERWEVNVRRVGAHFRVSPARGILGCDNWALTLNPRRSTGFWRCISGIYIRRQHPKTEKALAKAIADCTEWCRRHNEAEDNARAVLAGVRAEGRGQSNR